MPSTMLLSVSLALAPLLPNGAAAASLVGALVGLVGLACGVFSLVVDSQTPRAKAT